MVRVKRSGSGGPKPQTHSSVPVPSLYQPARTLLPLLPFSRHLGHFHLEVCFTSYSSLSCSHQHGKFLKDSVAYSSICNTQGPRILCVRSVIILHLFLPLPYVSYGISWLPYYSIPMLYPSQMNTWRHSESNTLYTYGASKNLWPTKLKFSISVCYCDLSNTCP